MRLLDSTNMFVAQKLLRFEGIHVDRRRNRHMTSIAEEQWRIQCEKNWEQHSDTYEIWMRLEMHCVWYCWIGVSVSESAYLTQFVTFKEEVEGWQRLSRVQHTQHRCRYNPPCGHGTALPHLSCSHRGPSNCLHLRTQSRQNRYRCCRSAHVWNMLDTWWQW